MTLHDRCQALPYLSDPPAPVKGLLSARSPSIRCRTAPRARKNGQEQCIWPPLQKWSWQPCGKDPAFTPELLLQLAGRHTWYTRADLHRLSLQEPLQLTALKQRWLEAYDNASRLPATQLGCLYLDSSASPVTPDLDAWDFPNLTRHWGSLRVVWPVVGPAQEA